jgi:hypothetical protein
MIKKLLFLSFIIPFCLALTVTDVVTPGRSVNGNMVSDADEDPEQPVFGNIQNSGQGENVTILWSAVTTDANGNPITLHSYELRYKLTTDTIYTQIMVPPQFVGHALTLSSGSYEGNVFAVDSNGVLSPASTFSFEVP